jgi:hypothetical protein
MIRITRRGWNHILKYHTATQFTSRRSKSKFYSTVDLVDLINRAASYPPTAYKGNHRRIFDAGTVVGVDRNTGQPTTTVTIFTRQNGDLITMFPGRQ